MSEQISPQLGDDSLRSQRQQVDLNVVETRLHQEQRDQPEPDAIEQHPVAGNERRVEQATDDLRERKRDGNAEHETHHRAGQPRTVRMNPRKESAERLGGWKSPPRLRLGHQSPIFRSATIAPNSSAR